METWQLGGTVRGCVDRYIKRRVLISKIFRIKFGFFSIPIQSCYEYLVCKSVINLCSSNQFFQNFSFSFRIENLSLSEAHCHRKQSHNDKTNAQATTWKIMNFPSILLKFFLSQSNNSFELYKLALWAFHLRFMCACNGLSEILIHWIRNSNRLNLINTNNTFKHRLLFLHFRFYFRHFNIHTSILKIKFFYSIFTSIRPYSSLSLIHTQLRII